MPFTPIHMGPGILIKSVLQGSFSLMVFGWTQIVMDLQPLFVIITGNGELHGFSHTYIGALLLSVFSALTGKHLSEFGLQILALESKFIIKISWRVAFLSAVIGSFSHVVLDSMMHSDIQPFFPFIKSNNFHGWLSIESIHKLCLYTGLLGSGIFYLTHWRILKQKK